MAQHLRGALGQPVALESRSGGSGVWGTEAVARSAQDGYTLAMTTSGPITILPQMMGSAAPHGPLLRARGGPPMDLFPAEATAFVRRGIEGRGQAVRAGGIRLG